MKTNKETKRLITEVINAIDLLNLRLGELSDNVDIINIPIIGTNNNDMSNIDKM